MGHIYSICNKKSNKRYIGQTIQPLHKRISQHFCQARKGVETPLYHALRKYARDDFDIELIETCDAALLNEREQYWILHFNTLKEGYNCDLGGAGGPGRKLSEDTKKRMSNSKKGKPSPRKGKVNSQESNIKRSESLKKSYQNGVRKQRDYSDVSGPNNANYKSGKYVGQYAKYRKKKIQE